MFVYLPEKLQILDVNEIRIMHMPNEDFGNLLLATTEWTRDVVLETEIPKRFLHKIMRSIAFAVGKVGQVGIVEIHVDSMIAQLLKEEEEKRAG